MGNYVVATTTETEGRQPKTPGAINGSFYQKTPTWPGQVASVVIAVDDLHAAMKQVVAAGGELLGQPMMIPEIGQYVAFYDTERNRLSMLQRLPRS